jgi:hypothetical protein
MRHSRREQTRRAAGWLGSLALLAAALALALAAGEVVTRRAFADVTTTGDYGSWFARNWQIAELGPGGSRLNSERRRGHEPAVPKPEGLYRIVLLGDSIAFGQGIPAEGRFGDVVQRALDPDRRRIEVVNFAKPGSELIHHRNTLHRLEPLEADYLLLQWFVNDFEGEVQDKAGRPTPRWLIPIKSIHYPLFRSSALYYVLNEQWARLQQALGMVGSYEDYMAQRFADPGSPDSRAAMSALDYIVEQAREHGVDMGLVLFPRLVPELGGGYPFDYLHERVLGYCAGAGLTCLDLRATYAPLAGDIGALHVNRFDAHPNARAHRLAAGRILEVFGPRWQAAAAAP